MRRGIESLLARATALGAPIVAAATLVACGDPSGDRDRRAARDAAPPGLASASAAARPSAVPGAPAEAADVPDAAADAPSRQLEGTVEVDLGDAGDPWKGLRARAPIGSTVAGDGGGGALVLLAGGRPVTISAWRPNGIAERRLGATTAAAVAGGTISFETDDRAAIAYTLRIHDVEGRPLTTRGFAVTVDAGFGRVVCAYATARDDAELESAREVCASLDR